MGARFGAFAVVAIRTRPSAFEVLLVRGREVLRVRLRAWFDGADGLRRGPWVVDVAGAAGLAELEPQPRRAVGELVRGLVGDDAVPPAAPSAPTRARGDGDARRVACTAPWTTMEVVDPDGLVRQCCADWTEGARGSVFDGSLLGLWNARGYQDARATMLGGAIGSLCHDICPRLYDHKFGEDRFEIIDGAPAFVENQRLIAREIAEGRVDVTSRPLYLAICPSTYCNYDCIMCLHGRSPRRELPNQIWDELPTLLPTLRVLTLLGGEPLANPLAMRFLRAYDRVSYPDAAVSLVTNGSLLGEQTLRHLGRCRFGHVTVSLNAGTAEVYEAVQRGVTLDEVLTNIDALRRFRDQDPRPFGITLSFVVQPANAHTLTAFGEVARARGLAIRLLPLSPRGPEGLDYYDDPDAVGAVLRHVDAFRAWAQASEPSFVSEIDATREAIAHEAATRRSIDGDGKSRVRLPLARK